MAKKAPSRIERVSEVINGLHGGLTLESFGLALAEAGLLDGVKVRGWAGARRYLRGLLRQHNRRCERIGDFNNVIFRIAEGKDSRTTKVTEA
jgi:hypothetical protein